MCLDLGCLIFARLQVLFQYFKSAILEAWNASVCSDLGQRDGFSGRCALGFEGFFATLICFPP